MNKQTKNTAARPAEWFTREIKKRVATDPAKAIRFDIKESEQTAAQVAYAVLNNPECAAAIDESRFTAIRHHQATFIQITGREGWALWRAEPLAPGARGKFERWTFFPPAYVWPQPVERKLVATVRETIEKRLNTGKLGREMKTKLQAEYGPEYFVAMPGATAADDPALPPGLYCDVWRGEDWEIVSRAEFYPAERVEAIGALDKHAEVMRHQRDDAAALGAAHVRRESVVAHLGSLPEGPTGDALRALDTDARQVYQLRVGLNAKGSRNTWAEVAAQFRSERKPGKRYTRARVQQIYRDAVKAFPALRDYSDALAARDSFRLDRDPTESEEIKAITSISEFDMDELAPNREGGAGYRVTRDLRNREI